MKKKNPATDGDTKAFEEALARQDSSDHYLLRLFVTGTTPRSSRAIQNIQAICEKRLQGRYQLEVIDIYQHPEQGRPEQIVVVPTLIKALPLPIRRLIGDFADNERVLAGLDLVPRQP